MRTDGIRVFRTSRARRLLLSTISLAACCVLPLSATPQQAQPSITEIAQLFHAPPEDTKPMVRWWWFGPAVEKPEILHELQQMKADNFGGVELAFVYPQVVDDPARGLKNLPFLSTEMLDAVNYAQTEGRWLGLRVDVTLCSGWPYGGPATTLAHAAERLRVLALPLQAEATTLPGIKLSEGDSIVSTFVATGPPDKWDASSAQQVAATAAFPPSKSTRTALFFVASHTLQQVKRAAVDAEGFVLDPFSQQAVATHLKAVGEPLLQAFGATPPYAIFSDSLETYGADWTPLLPEEFRKRRGYDLLPHLPELVAGGTLAAEQIRHDYGRTLTDLVDENYLVQINTWAHDHHTKFRSQTYGEPAVSLASQRLVDLPEGEGPQWREFSTLRWATSANHLFGNRVSSGETFTWLHSPVFRATPLDMKAEADLDFIMGENQLTYHGWPYSAPQTDEPGWSLYAAAVFNDHNPWHPVMPSINTYVQRLSFLLRQGEPANQVALLLPTDDAWAGFSPGKVSVSEAMKTLISPRLMSAVLSAGYNVDFTDADTINRLGIHHSILVLPPTRRIPLETLRIIAAWTQRGGRVIAVGHVPSLGADGTASDEFAALTRQIFRRYAVGARTYDIAAALHRAATPDLQIAQTDSPIQGHVGFLRRSLPDADIYFIANISNTAVHTRAVLASKFINMSRWYPDTGVSTRQHTGVRNPSLDIELAPYESAVYIISNQPLPARPTFAPARASLRQLLDLSHNWQLNFTSLDRTVTESDLQDWTANPATLHYSGEVVYRRNFKLNSIPGRRIYLEIDGGASLDAPPALGRVPLPPLGKDGLPNPELTLPGPGMHAKFIPPVREAAVVVINGRAAGALWHPPYRLDVTDLLRSGDDNIEIHVYNTALNAWSANPPHDYAPLIVKFGDRFQMQDLDKVKPISSGLLGDIRLLTETPHKHGCCSLRATARRILR